MRTSSLPMRRRDFALLLAAPALAALPGCGGGDDDDPDLAGRVVYVMTNAAAGNEVLAFRREADGTLTRFGAYATGGNGLGTTEISPATPQDGIDVLASQGSLKFSPGRRLLFACNAGSSSVTCFRVDSGGALTRMDVEPSGGLQPNTIATRSDLIYVGNVGSAANGFQSTVSGFAINADFTLTPIAGSTRSLSTPTAQPSNLTFSPDGGLLAVSELTTNRVSMFLLASDGTLSAPTVNPSSGPGPFGARWLSPFVIVVSEAQAPGVPGSVSSYSVGGNGLMTPITPSVSSGQMATCWVFVTPDYRFLYTSNTASGTVSSYSIASDGSLTLLQSVASALEGPTSGPIDGGVSEDGQHLYILDSGIGAITAHRINGDGTLTKIQTVTGNGIPTLGAQGLAVR